MKREIIDNKEFIVFNDGNIKVRFSTALNNVNYKKEDEEEIGRASCRERVLRLV